MVFYTIHLVLELYEGKFCSQVLSGKKNKLEILNNLI